MDNQEKRISREEAEKRILLGLEDIWSDYMAYNPEGTYIQMYIIRDKNGVSISAGNIRWADDKDHPIDLYKIKGVE